MIYAKQVDANTYMLVNRDGRAVDAKGELAYHPWFYTGQAQNSGYPVYGG